MQPDNTASNIPPGKALTAPGMPANDGSQGASSPGASSPGTPNQGASAQADGATPPKPEAPKTAKIIKLPRRTRDEREFLPAALEIIDTPPSPVGRAVGLTIIALAVIALIWACVGQVDIIATTSGRIIPQGKTKVVQPVDTGIVAAIHVADGDHVKAGDLLIEFNTAQSLADRDRYARDLLQAKLSLARLRGIAAVLSDDGTITQKPVLVDPPVNATPEDLALAQAAMRAQAANQAAKLSDLDQQIISKKADAAESQATADKLTASLPMVQSQEQIRRQLRDMEYGNKLAWYQANQALIEQQHEIDVMAKRKDGAEAAQSALSEQRLATAAEFQVNVLSDLDKTRAQASELEAELAKAQQRLSQGVLKAPIDGTVQQLAVHTIGGVVTPAEALLSIVPDDGRLVVEATVQNRDVGFIRAGQMARLKVETFNFTRYGLIDGEVLNVTRDAVNVQNNNDKKNDRNNNQDDGQDVGAANNSGPGYIARIALSRDWIMTETGKVPLSPGMAVTAEVQTGKRRVIEYLLSPLVRHVSESMHER